MFQYSSCIIKKVNQVFPQLLKSCPSHHDKNHLSHEKKPQKIKNLALVLLDTRI